MKILNFLKIYRRNPDSNYFFRFILNELFFFYNLIKNLPKFIFLRNLSKKKIENNKHKKIKKILFISTFHSSMECLFHDFVLAKNLEIKGSEIIPVSIGSFKFGGNKFFSKYHRHPHEMSESHTPIYEKILWKFICKSKLLTFDDFINLDIEGNVKKIFNEYESLRINNVILEDLDLLECAITKMINSNGVSDYKLIKNYKKKLDNYLYHSIFTFFIIKNILKNIEPDTVIMSDSFYYPSKIVEHLCKKNKISSYNYFYGIRKNCFFYSKDKPCQSRNIDHILKENEKLNYSQIEQLREYLDLRPTGTVSHAAQYENPLKNSPIIFDQNKILKNIDKKEKKNILLIANVSNDLNALNRSIAFKDQFDWIEKVTKFISLRNDCNLIIKPHPAEINVDMVPVIQTVKSEISKRKLKLKENIILLEANTNLSSYKLLDYTDICLVYTSTVGIEYAINNKPVFTAGASHYRKKNFTIDTETQEEYFNKLKNFIENYEFETKKIFDKKQSDKAFRYFYLYSMVFAKNIKAIEYANFKINLNFSNLEELITQKFKLLNNVTDSILIEEEIK